VGRRVRPTFDGFEPGALIKIDILVPPEQLDRAREVWAELETAPQIVV
jgi:hypothetical protein